MKTMTKVAAGMVAILVFVSQAAFAATATTGAVSVNATVDSTLTLDAHMFKDSAPVNGVGGGPTGPEILLSSGMNFGQLREMTFVGAVGTPDEGKIFKELRSDDQTGIGGFVVLLSANSHGLAYVITQTADHALTNGTADIPGGACRIVPFYADADSNGQGPIPSGASVGPKASWVTAGSNTIYTSGSGAGLRTVQAHLSIAGTDPGAGGTTPVPVTQPGGSYSGHVTFTVTA